MARPKKIRQVYGGRVRRYDVAYGRANKEFTAVYQRPLPQKPGAVESGRAHRPALDTESGAKQVGPFYVQGRKASDLEWRVYQALKRLGWSDPNIDFQTDILGGRMPGGQVLDFVVYGFGTVTVIPVNGDYWHRYGADYNRSLEAEAQVKEVMPSANVVALWTGDLISDEQAYRVLLRLVGRGY